MKAMELPIFMRVGNLDELEIGRIQGDTAELSQRSLVNLLRAVADEVEKKVDAEKSDESV
jgi:hypothetical protein